MLKLHKRVKATQAKVLYTESKPAEGIDFDGSTYRAANGKHTHTPFGHFQFGSADGFHVGIELI